MGDRVAIVMADGDAVYQIKRGTPEHEESMEWARFHGLDPNRIPQGSLIERDAAARCIRYTEFLFDPPESRDYADMVLIGCEPRHVERVEQGEAPPLPFPWGRP